MNDVQFKFEIGSFVVSRAAMADMNCFACLQQGRMPVTLQVLEQRYQRCYGGVQLSYVVSTLGGKVERSEIELMAYDEAFPKIMETLRKQAGLE